MPSLIRTKASLVLGAGATLALGAGGLATMSAAAPVPTTVEDFFLPGTQPETLNHPIVDATQCAACHSEPAHDFDPVEGWTASMMSQSARDPLFHACLTIANQDVAFAGDLCIRCHAPKGWLEGRSEPTDGSALTGADFQGVSCNFCHRMVDPENIDEPNPTPAADREVFDGVPGTNAGVDSVAPNPHTGAYVVDFNDRRRGPFDLGPNFFYHDWELSPFHQKSAMCATCHDVSNPAFTEEPDGSYALNDLDTAHPSANKYDMFPVERTYSEWLMSDFSLAPIDMGGRFGGEKVEVSTCQDCHMPDRNANACQLEPTNRPDMPQHAFNGGNNWVIKAVRELYPDNETGLTDQAVADTIARAESMLGRASDMELSVDGSTLTVRVINQTGHKLPTGYPEGRRMWINVRFLDEKGGVVAERGAYDDATAELTESDTKVYEAKLGIGPKVAALSGLPEGPGFHFAANNTWFKDNRIPPRGFTNANFEAIQAEPIDYSYADGQYWDDTDYQIPTGATEAEVRVYFQLVSKEYIEFLRDENVTDNTGQIAYDQWVMHGKSPKVEMDAGTIALDSCLGDLSGNGSIGFEDLNIFISAFTNDDPIADLSGNGSVGFEDVNLFVSAFQKGCP